MKYEKKLKEKEKRNLKKQQREKQKEIEKNRIINIITPEQIALIKLINRKVIVAENMERDSLQRLLITLIEIVRSSSYLNEVTIMTKRNISNTWFDIDIDEEFVKDVLDKELKSVKNAPDENIALKITYWANRIAHHVQEEVIPKNNKMHHVNELYIQYFLNPKYNYDVTSKRSLSNEKRIKQMLEKVIIENAVKIDGINSPEQLNDLFFGLTLRNELWTLKQEMLKIMLLYNLSKEKTSIKITALPEDENVTIRGKKTMRMIIREVNGISPIVMHCDGDKVDEFLQANNFPPIPIEDSENIIEFARDGKIGIYFTLDDENKEILDYEASCNSGKTPVLNEILYRGDEYEER